MPHLKFNYLRCPSCRRRLAPSLSPHRVGPGIRTCRYCSVRFRDGSKEWPDMTGKEKLNYALPPAIWLLIAFELLLTATEFFQAAKPQRPILGDMLIPLAVIVLTLAAHFMKCTVEIAASKRRVRRLVRPGYAPPLE